MLATETQAIETFISYADEDQELKRELDKHLGNLERSNLINIWSADRMAPGTFRQQETETHLDTAEVVLLLVSPDYLSSDQTYTEMEHALNRFNSGLMHLIPIILRPVDLSGTALDNLAKLPTGGKAVVNWQNRDDAFFDITRNIRGQIEEILDQKQLQSLSPSPNKLVQAIIRQGNLEKGAIEKNLTADTPVQDLREDQLGFDVYTRALRDFIASQETPTPLTIGIHGPWGSGKSSLMRMLQKELDPPLGVWKRLQLIWSRVVWLFFFFTTTPIWVLGQIVLRIASKFSRRQHNWVEQLKKDLGYDPSDPKTYSTSTSQRPPQHLRFWQRIALQRHPNEPATLPTVWFNAWKFDQEEELWAALALEVLDQIKQKYSFLQRIMFWLNLSRKRFSLSSFLRAVALPLLFGIVDLVYTAYMKQLPNIVVQVFRFQIPLGHLLLWAGILVSAWIQVLKVARDPFQIEVKNVFDKPNYKDKVGFIGSFDKDFSRIVSLITRPRLGRKATKLVIFIDDLDRCEAPKAADIIEGINLFLDAKGCVFLLGMDTVAVTASIENKYNDLFQKIRDENVDTASPGRLFLEKIIQVPFQVPPSTDEGMGRFVKSLTKSPVFADEQEYTTQPNNGVGESQIIQKVATPSPTPLAAKAIVPDPASYKHDDVSKAMEEGALFLPENPRQVKRFINLFRLYVYIAAERNLFTSREDSMDKQKPGLNLKRLAIWVVWSMRWDEIVKSLLEEAKLSREELRTYLLDICKLVQDDGSWIPSTKRVGDWQHYKGLLEAVRLKKGEETASSHWSHLSWQRLLLNKDFLICLKEMESFWRLPQPGINEDDWLHILLTMNRVTFTPQINASTDNTNVSRKKTIKLPDMN
jgi:hypothetical protein